MLVCGEPSGDQLGAELMTGLQQLCSGVKIVGVGGPAMTAHGLHSLFPLDATAVMGLREVVPRIPEILRRVRAASDFALATRPDAVVCIDSPDFTHRIAQRIRRRDPTIPTVNYVAPQVWASRQYRARKMARYFDLVLALLPFEATFFEKHHLYAAFVGHPVIERTTRMTGGAALRSRLSIPIDAPLLLILPGSRMSEVRPLLPIFRDTVARLRSRIPNLVCILPAVSHVESTVRALSENWPAPLHIVNSVQDKFAAFDAADVALAASGTVTTELALAGTPMVVTYKLGWVTYALMRPFINVPYVALPNLLLGREAIPELLQARCRADLLAEQLEQLFLNAEVREMQKRDLAEAAAILGVGGEPPSLRAARALLDFVQQPRADKAGAAG
jgi:lipid-A-disaccharide synthase